LPEVPAALGVISPLGVLAWLLLSYKQAGLQSEVKESVFLTAKTSAMVCWLFVGSAIFSAAFALLGGQELVEKWVMSMNLTKTEFRLLVELASSPGRVFSREVLLERVWGYGYFGDGRLVDVHIRRLRTKIEPDPANPRHVATVRGLGYKLQT
jgi:hypothetical protein